MFFLSGLFRCLLIHGLIEFQSWIKPLQTSEIIPEERREDFILSVFWNVLDIINVNIKLRDALNKRQKSYAVIDSIGDIFLDIAPQFGPFVNYGSHQLYGKFEFEKEKSSNPAFANFVEVSADEILLLYFIKTHES
jgi:hypothetical protein